MLVVYIIYRGCLTKSVLQFLFFDVDFSILTATIVLFKITFILKKNELIVLSKSLGFQMKVTNFHIHLFIH